MACLLSLLFPEAADHAGDHVHSMRAERVAHIVGNYQTDPWRISH
jgi:hypothetical protein